MPMRDHKASVQVLDEKTEDGRSQAIVSCSCLCWSDLVVDDNDKEAEATARFRHDEEHAAPEKHRWTHADLDMDQVDIGELYGPYTVGHRVWYYDADDPHSAKWPGRIIDVAGWWSNGPEHLRRDQKVKLHQSPTRMYLVAHRFTGKVVQARLQDLTPREETDG